MVEGRKTGAQPGDIRKLIIFSHHAVFSVRKRDGNNPFYAIDLEDFSSYLGVVIVRVQSVAS
jgi:hypothetical protein